LNVPAVLRSCRKRPRPLCGLAARPRVELLETRNLLSGVLPPPAETLGAQDRELAPGHKAVGALGAGPAGAADVDWFHFHLDSDAAVTLATADGPEGRPLVPVLSLYNTADPFTGDPTVSDYYERMGHRLLAQQGGSPGHPDVVIERLLGPGDYYVAVSGAGNLYFNPFLAGSGYAGATGDFSLTLTEHALNLDPSTPAVLATDPASGSVLSGSPFVIRLDLSTDIDPTVFDLTQLQLLYSPDASFTAAAPVDATPTYTFSPLAHEIQITPGAVLKPGYYRVQLGTGGQALANPENLSLIFQVDGIEGQAAALGGDGTAATAHELGSVTSGKLVQVTGTLGVDYTDDFTPFDPNDVDYYAFSVMGQGQFQITAEIFANRTGSPLDAAVSLFRLGNDGLLHFVAANANTTNPTDFVGDGNGTGPLYTDPELTAGLSAGHYFLVVSSGLNVPDPALGPHPGDPGVFDPNDPSVAGMGNSTGPYVLNFMVQPHHGVPHVVAVTRDDGGTPGGSPARFTVKFDEPVDVTALAYEAYQAFLLTGQGGMSAVFVQGPGGSQYYPRLESYDPAANTATFVMLNGLPTGTYRLHLSGALGLTDLAGDPLVGNQPGSGDFVYSFSVSDPMRDQGTDPLVVYRNRADNGVQNLGPLFAEELLAQVTPPGGGAPVGVGVTVTRDFSQHPVTGTVTDTQDVYRIQLLYFQQYAFRLVDQSTGISGAVSLVLSTDAQGLHVIPAEANFPLDPGTYYVHVLGWQAKDAGKVKYQLHIVMQGSPERPTPLTVGAAPAIRIQIASSLPPPPPPTAPPAASTGPAPPTGLAGIPSGILVALGAGVFGGTATGVSAGGKATLPGLEVLDRVVALAPRFLREDEVVQLVSLVQAPQEAADDGLVGDTVPVRTGTVPDLSSWGQAVDWLFRLWTSFEQQFTEVSRLEKPLETGLEDSGQEAETGLDLSDGGLWAVVAPGLFAAAWPPPLRHDGKGSRRPAGRTPARPPALAI
jgi:hypothetical protein